MRRGTETPSHVPAGITGRDSLRREASPRREETRSAFLLDFVNQGIFDRFVYILGHGIADLFTDMRNRAQGSANQRKALGELPGNAHVQRNRGNRASNIGREAAIMMRLGGGATRSISSQ